MRAPIVSSLKTKFTALSYLYINHALPTHYFIIQVLKPMFA
jgi:hypothetical protein